MQVESTHEGFLTAVVWPTYVGVLDIGGYEPLNDYQRGQIFWQTDEKGKVFGRGKILVPKGYFSHIAYYYHPVLPIMVGHQVINHPFDFRCPGVIDIDEITEKDFTQLPTPQGFVLPLGCLAVR